jgi:Ser-tRNA(Ala) deacylase AlaX
MTILRYLDDDATTGTAVVTALADGERPTVRLRETWFHPQGGGQPGDRGTLGAMRVIDTRIALDGQVDHFVDQLIGISVADACRFEIDAATRARNSRYHTAAHLLVGLAERVLPGLKVVAGHQWPGEARVDFEGRDAGTVVEHRDEIETVVRAAIAADCPVTIGVAGSERFCQVGTLPPIACSGTHVASTGCIGFFSIRAVRARSGRIRVGYDLQD